MRGMTSVAISSIERWASLRIDPVHAGVDQLAEVADLLAQARIWSTTLFDRAVETSRSSTNSWVISLVGLVECAP